MNEWRDRRSEHPNLAYEGQDRRYLPNGSLSPSDRFQRIEDDQRDFKRDTNARLDSIETKLDRLFGAMLLAAATMPVVLWLLNRTFPAG